MKDEQMQTQRKALPRRVAAGIGALALGLMGALGGGMAANAQTIEGPNIDDVPGSIIVHKFEQPSPDPELANDGTIVDTSALTPLDGVTFSVQQVTSIDLLTWQGWDDADGLTAADVLDDPATYPLDTAVTGVTGADTEPEGTATFEGLPVGLYLVTETDTGDNPIAVKAEPFLVSIPLPMEDNMWLYDVHVYPKNAVTAIEKTVDDSAASGLGDTVSWKVSANVPNLPAGDVFTTFVINDTLDARLGYESATVTLTDSADVVIPLLDTDFALSAPALGANGAVDVTFTADGLSVLNGVQGGTVTLDIDTEVISIGDGSIENEATVYINEFEGTVDAVTNWGALQILKFAIDNDERDYLAGAEFQIFGTEADAIDLENPIAVDGVLTFTTDNNGEILIEGLKVGTYWVVETQAPAGYTGNSTPIEVAVVVGPTTDPVVVEVENVQRPPVDLPLTGASGVLLLTLGGAGLLSLAGGTALVNHRRKNA